MTDGQIAYEAYHLLKEKNGQSPSQLAKQLGTTPEQVRNIMVRCSEAFENRLEFWHTK